MTKYRYTATIEIEADDQNQADQIINLIKKEGQFPDGSIVDSRFNIIATAPLAYWNRSK